MSFGNPWRRRSRRARRDDSNEDSENNDFGSLDPFDLDFRFGFGNIDEMIERMFKIARESGSTNIGGTIGPVYYGYSVTTGPDGKPHVREFGNVKPTRSGNLELGSREPFVDSVVDEKENKLKIIAEMPGVQREDIKLEILEDKLKIKAEHGDRRYETTVPIQTPVETSTASATYNNGVLEVTMKLKSQLKPKGVSIKVD